MLGLKLIHISSRGNKSTYLGPELEVNCLELIRGHIKIKKAWSYHSRDFLYENNKIFCLIYLYLLSI